MKKIYVKTIDLFIDMDNVFSEKLIKHECKELTWYEKEGSQAEALVDIVMRTYDIKADDIINIIIDDPCYPKVTIIYKK